MQHSFLRYFCASKLFRKLCSFLFYPFSFFIWSLNDSYKFSPCVGQLEVSSEDVERVFKHWKDRLHPLTAPKSASDWVPCLTHTEFIRRDDTWLDDLLSPLTVYVSTCPCASQIKAAFYPPYASFTLLLIKHL